MLRLDHVTFGYGAEVPVVRDFSLEIPQGGRVCLTGPSGQGKTTVLRLLLGLEAPRQGTVFVPAGTRFSAVFQEDRLLPWKTTLENAALFSDAALGRALAHPFDVLVLDEALTGLDDETRARCLAVIDRAAGARTLVMATHNPAEAQALRARPAAVT